MIAYYQRVIGVPFPWEKYDHTTAERYIFGGMEDTSATLISTRFLHPAIEEIEAPCDYVVSHELAQQWWGDDASMTDWANIWLHEGFATYYDELWTGHRWGEADFEYARYQAQQEYFDETTRYLRPIVDPVYADPIDLFDASSHERPAEVLHMLRTMFGDARFFAATRTYLQRYAYKNVDTDHFFKSIDASLGTNLTWFEREWFYRDDYPHYYVSDSYNGTAHTRTLNIKQRNIDGKPFRMPIAIEAYFGARRARIEPVIDRNEQTVTIPGVTTAPDMVLFDPNNNVLRQLTFPQSEARLAYQLAHATHVAGREWALAQFAGMRDTPSRDAVRHAAESDSFYGLRADAVAIGATSGDDVVVANGLHDVDVRVRLSALAAAGDLTGQPVNVIRDAQVMSTDADPNVVAAALLALGKLHAPGAYDLLVSALNRHSFRETVASGALRGLAAIDDARAIPLIASRTRYGVEDDERNVAIIALAQAAHAANQPQTTLPILVGILTHDPLIASRLAATTALRILDNPAALPALERAERSDPQVFIQEGAAAAIRAIAPKST